MSFLGPLAQICEALDKSSVCDLVSDTGGVVVGVDELCIRAEGLSDNTRIGDVFCMPSEVMQSRLEVVSTERSTASLVPLYGEPKPLIGAAVVPAKNPSNCDSSAALGKVVNALGDPILTGIGLSCSSGADGERSRASEAPHDVSQYQPLSTGVRIIDLFTPLAFGQRFGIFAGSGVGKTSLLSMLARAQDFDIVIICLVGERMREAREFIAATHATPYASKAIFVVSTSSETAAMRQRAAPLALNYAKQFSAQGKRVLVLIDSLTRHAHAKRETASAAGELPIQRGYPASVFAALGALVEQAGSSITSDGSITMIATVLVDGDDHNDPIADGLRGFLDGHLVLDRAIADVGRFPAVDIRKSISRLADKIWSNDQKALLTEIKALIARFEETQTLRLLSNGEGATDKQLEKAIDIVPKLYEFLKQDLTDQPTNDPFVELVKLLK